MGGIRLAPGLIWIFRLQILNIFSSINERRVNKEVNTHSGAKRTWEAGNSIYQCCGKEDDTAEHVVRVLKMRALVK